jgi:hypothetical protein
MVIPFILMISPIALRKMHYNHPLTLLIAELIYGAHRDKLKFMAFREHQGLEARSDEKEMNQSF